MTARLTWGDERDLIPVDERCDACPVGCRSCTGERSGCECYEHDTPYTAEQWAFLNGEKQ